MFVKIVGIREDLCYVIHRYVLFQHVPYRLSQFFFINTRESWRVATYCGERTIGQCAVMFVREIVTVYRVQRVVVGAREWKICWQNTGDRRTRRGFGSFV